MSIKVKVICDGSIGRSGVILHGVPPVTSAHDVALGHNPPPKWDYLELKPGINELEITPEKLLAWQILARDAGLVIAKARGVYVVTDLLNGANDGVRHLGLRPSAAPTVADGTPAPKSILELALASDRVVCVR